MNKLNIYLDTSVINFIFANDAPEKRDITIEYFDRFIKTGYYTHYISEIVVSEIKRTKEIDIREKLLKVLNDYKLDYIELNPLDEIEDLTTHYINSKVIPAKKIDDALHVAVCTVKKIDILLSWNFRHLANINKERKIMVANIEAGYSFTPRLTNPMEVYSDL